ncbi:uncharacterized protein LOC109611633 [Musca domestica]|uniref:Uncharacterized protein LOC109611633 n=1 Tax=Musca domestica TaxID=7370 RepID=A0A9J7DDH3_MUSDO|nr:uncharacterized protein LOC109611633 [Musca domestica]
MASNLIKQARLGFLRSIQTAPRLWAKFKDGGEQSTFNDMPIPEGCWKEFNAKRQSRQTMMLLSGLASFVASIVYVTQTELLFFNYTVPDYPYEDEE